MASARRSTGLSRRRPEPRPKASACQSYGPHHLQHSLASFCPPRRMTAPSHAIRSPRRDMTPAAVMANRLCACRNPVLSRRTDTPHAINKTNPARPSGIVRHRSGAPGCGRAAFGQASDPGGCSIPVCLLVSTGVDSFAAAFGYKYRCEMICLRVEAPLHSKWIAAFPQRCSTPRGCPPSRQLSTRQARCEYMVRTTAASG